MKKRQVGKLLQLTSEAFEAAAPPSLQGLSFDESLRAFAIFTRDEAEKALRSGKDLSAIDDTLYHRALELGAQYRRWLGIRKIDDVMSAARVLYGFFGIDFLGTSSGKITIRRCFFSEYYSSAVCKCISAMDAGLLTGLSGGRRLMFSQRITEGAPACIGVLAEGEQR